MLVSCLDNKAKALLKILKVEFKRAFSMAEVLITISIIGVVAALVIPATVKHFNDMDTVAKVQKAHSILNNAIKKYQADNGCIGDLTLCENFIGTNHSDAAKAFIPYLSVVKNCGIATGQGCFPSINYKQLNGGNDNNFDTYGLYTAILADGSLIVILNNPDNCSTDNSRNNTGPFYYVCGAVGIDINGHKGPNQRGRDYFSWAITKYGVYPYGSSDDENYTDTNGDIRCNKNATGNTGRGSGCTAKVLKEGKINY